MEYLKIIRRVYLNEKLHDKLYGKVFVIIGNGNPVEPRDPACLIL